MSNCRIHLEKDKTYLQERFWVPHCLAQRQRKYLQTIFTTKKYDFKIYYALTLQVRQY